MQHPPVPLYDFHDTGRGCIKCDAPLGDAVEVFLLPSLGLGVSPGSDRHLWRKVRFPRTLPSSKLLSLVPTGIRGHWCGVHTVMPLFHGDNVVLQVVSASGARSRGFLWLTHFWCFMRGSGCFPAAFCRPNSLSFPHLQYFTHPLHPCLRHQPNMRLLPCFSLRAGVSFEISRSCNSSVSQTHWSWVRFSVRTWGFYRLARFPHSVSAALIERS